jgi:cbb3-type cytochrome oxidase subunit 3
MALTLLSFFALAIAGFGVCQVLTRRLELPTNALINLGLGFFLIMAGVSFIVSQSWLAISTVSQAILLVSCCAAAVTALDFNRGSRLALSADIPLGSRLTLFDAVCLCLIAGYLTLILLNNMSQQVFPWDAFTTWMFRAKAWVTTDQAVDFATFNEWLVSGSGFTLPAAHYPISLSAVAAFAAAVSGGWSDQAASIPWFFAMTASALIMAGLCRLQTPNHPIATLFGATLLVTAPLVHWHGVLAGYADIWVMGTSGMGLAGICIWTQSKARSTLAVSLLLLALGCLWKSEGWLWATLGCGVAMAFYFWPRRTLWGWVVIAPVAVALGFAQPLDLGPLGRWGVTESVLSAGWFGVFAARPFNPAPAFLEMSILQSNFLLLVPLYGIALVTLLLMDFRDNFGYLLMALCLIAVHFVIFGLSEHSFYAETGTALNRLLLQNLPVLIVTITAVLQSKALLSGPVMRGMAIKDPAKTNPVTQRSAINIRRRRKWRQGLLAGTLAIMALAVALPLTLVISSWAMPQSTSTATRIVSAGELQAVVGSLQQTHQGYRFRRDNIPVGVAAIPLPQSNAIQPRYVVSQSWMRAPGILSFYWINNEEPGVHSTPLPLSGWSVLDMAEYQDFWQKPIAEMGFLAKPRDFNQAAIRSVTLTDSLLNAIPALIHHWVTPAPLSHRLINSTTGHLMAPIALQRVLVVALMLIIVIGVTWWLLAPASKTAAVRGMLLAVSGLWLLGSTTHLNQVCALMRAPPEGANAHADTVKLDGAHLIPLIASVKQNPALTAAPMLTASLDRSSHFEAQRLPFMALPTSAAAIDASALTQVVTNFSGTVVLLGKDAYQLKEKTTELARISLLRPLQSGEGYVLLSPEVE